MDDEIIGFILDLVMYVCVCAGLWYLAKAKVRIFNFLAVFEIDLLDKFENWSNKS